MKDEEIRNLRKWGEIPPFYAVGIKRLKLLWKAFVRTAAVLCVISGLIIAYMSYMQKLDEDLMGRSPLIQEIRKMEADGRRKEIWIKLVNDIHDVSDDDGDLVINWLKKRLSDGTAPYYYVLSLYYMKKANSEGSKDIATKGIDYYSAGKLVYRADALRCSDPASVQTVSAIESALFGTSIEDTLNKHRDLKISSLAWALKQEKKTKNRKPSSWICTQEIKQWTGDGGLSPDELWSVKRQAFRKPYVEFVLKAEQNR